MKRHRSFPRRHRTPLTTTPGATAPSTTLTRRLVVLCAAAILATCFAAVPARAAVPPANDLGSPAWHAALIEGAATHVPFSVSPGYVDVDGQPFAVQTRITAVQFHVPGVPSGVPGGLFSTPTPVRKVDNGVEYWQVSGELSAQVVEYSGFRWVVGPIGPDGVDHRFDTDRSHPRGQLPGAHFVLRYPARGFNGRLVAHQAAYDGGNAFPAAAIAWFPVDTMALLDRGYGLFTVSLGGSAPAGEIDGQRVIDSNPDSGTGIYWAAGADNSDAYLRPYRLDASGREVAYPDPSPRSIWIPGEGWVEENIGDPYFGDTFGVPLQSTPELTRDGIVVAKRLLQQLTGSTAPPWTVYLGWSGSGETAAVLSMGRVVGPLRMPPGPVPYNGGNFNRFHDPASGRRYDAFVSFGALRTILAFEGDEEWRPAEVDDRFPVGAPTVWIGGDLDGLGLSLSGVVYANKLARALPGSALSGTPIERLVATYDLTNVPHATHDAQFMNERRHGTQVGLRYERVGSYPVDAGFNTEGRGELVQPTAVAHEAAQPGIFEDDWPWRFSLDIPRTTPLFLQTIENLHGLTTEGRALPVSRIEARLFERLDEVDGDTPYPLVPMPCPTLEWTDENPFVIGQAMESCAPTITEDAVLAVRFPWGDEFPSPLEQAVIEEARWFVEHNPLPHLVDSIEVPDVAAALGPVLLFGQSMLGRRLTDAQLREGFVASDGRVYRYANHNAWVRVFRDTTSSLIAAGLWDRAMGHQYVAQAQRSDVLR